MKIAARIACATLGAFVTAVVGLIPSMWVGMIGGLFVHGGFFDERVQRAQLIGFAVVWTIFISGGFAAFWQLAVELQNRASKRDT